jgi:NADH:ubiquinone oxidoreductase subunit 3 (subunit A)
MTTLPPSERDKESVNPYESPNSEANSEPLPKSADETRARLETRFLIIIAVFFIAPIMILILLALMVTRP